ncbi:MAG: vitamin B12 dependent-methionine synthase activation domain-containing protein [Planctomycetota bacterium]
MTELLTFSAAQVTPDRAAVFETQGLPAGQEVPEGTETLYTAAIDLFAEAAAPVGILSEISPADFEIVYHGEGRNEPRTPVGDIFGRADRLALFVVTLGEAISREIAARFGARDFALGYMLDSVASTAADHAAKVAERRFLEGLSRTRPLAPGTGVLCYSPGYCGWDISGQKKLFEFLHPEPIGVTLRDSFLMQPLKSVSGVLIAGPKALHRFSNDYPFCSRCETLSCRERVRTGMAE